MRTDRTNDPTAIIPNTRKSLGLHLVALLRPVRLQHQRGRADEGEIPPTPSTISVAQKCIAVMPRPRSWRRPFTTGRAQQSAARRTARSATPEEVQIVHRHDTE
jgi:hypothetical protein